MGTRWNQLSSVSAGAASASRVPTTRKMAPGYTGVAASSRRPRLSVRVRPPDSTSRAATGSQRLTASRAVAPGAISMRVPFTNTGMPEVMDDSDNAVRRHACERCPLLQRAATASPVNAWSKASGRPREERGQLTRENAATNFGA